MPSSPCCSNRGGQIKIPSGSSHGHTAVTILCCPRESRNVSRNRYRQLPLQNLRSSIFSIRSFKTVVSSLDHLFKRAGVETDLDFRFIEVRFKEVRGFGFGRELRTTTSIRFLIGSKVTSLRRLASFGAPKKTQGITKGITF